MRPDRSRKFIGQTSRNDQLHSSVSHLPKLPFRNPFLQGQKVLALYAIGFVENLTPTVFASGLAKERQPHWAQRPVAIFFDA